MIKRISWNIVLVAVLALLALPWWFVLQGLSLQLPTPGAELWNYPGIGTALANSLLVGLLSTLLAAACASLIIACEAVSGRPGKNDGGTIFTAPHLAFAIAFLWLFTPFGWFDRLFPFAAGLVEQQSLVTLVIILVLKETPFLVVLGRQQLMQLPYQRWLLQGQALGTDRTRSWWLVVFPAWLRAMRLILFAVAIYSVAVVDLAQIAGPLNPPLLAPLLVGWQLQFDPLSQLLAQQATWLLIALGGVMVSWVVIQEWGLVRLLKLRIGRPPSRALIKALSGFSLYFSSATRLLFILISALTLAALLALSLGYGWFYPDLLPLEWQLKGWSDNADLILQLALNTLGLGLLTAVIATASIIWLREWQRLNQRELPDLWLLLALFVPQLSLVIAWLGSDWSSLLRSHHLSVLVAHSWFSFAYGYLVYAPTERNTTQIHLLTGRSLGYGYWRSWWHFKRPLMHSGIGYCFMVTFLVSVAQYVPTLLLGAGRLPTLTTELVAVSSGGEWRLPAVYATLLWFIAFVALMLVQLTRSKQNLARES
ncbi:hypothetical protein J6I92_01205 [Pseudidiomarina sp. 1APR75-15]|uniref:ABC transporter permease n=1 Tax=Pseudidiomarina terrestris TaxID=2820060 RepID=A0ABT8MEW8_9GAMM|nr:hypothetical protein [Pseudidiomarina sp. 1APR75-15]MDN7128495.1 hypothetical protein [Pseudidiomarina sp. 1APR75-15]